MIPESILELIREFLELSWQPGGLLEASWTGFSGLDGQKAPKTEPGRVQNRVPEATRAENGEITKLSVCLTKFPGFF